MLFKTLLVFLNPLPFMVDVRIKSLLVKSSLLLTRYRTPLELSLFVKTCLNKSIGKVTSFSKTNVSVFAGNSNKLIFVQFGLFLSQRVALRLDFKSKMKYLFLS